MDIYVYSDESGVFDRVHNDWFVFGGVVLLSKEEKDHSTRKYIHAENTLRASRSFDKSTELKASVLSNKDKGKLFRSLNQMNKFGVVIKQKALHEKIFGNKKSKQRYLDYAYKTALKYAFQNLIQQGCIIPDTAKRIFVYVDEHTTATNGRYELQEMLEQEFKIGTFNTDYRLYYAPVFRQLQAVQVSFCDSRTKPLIRAADMIANRIYWDAIRTSGMGDLPVYTKMNLLYLP